MDLCPEGVRQEITGEETKARPRRARWPGVARSVPGRAGD